MAADGSGVIGVFSGIVDKVSFISQVPLLTRATSDDDEPIPGYWLEEIKTGCKAHIIQLVQFLAATLDNRSGRIKLKALRIMEFVSQQDVAFREALSGDDGCVKEAAKWLGPVGSGLQEAVRAKARQLLLSLHDPDWRPASARQSLAGMGTAPSIGKMLGFGRSAHREESATEKVRGLLDSLFGPAESQSDRSVRDAYTANVGQYRRVQLSQSRPIVRWPDQLQPCVAARDTRGAEAVKAFCSAKHWPVSRSELLNAARCSDLGVAVLLLSEILESDCVGSEIWALLLVEVLLRRGAPANGLRAPLTRLAERGSDPTATKARKVLLLMDAVKERS